MKDFLLLLHEFRTNEYELNKYLVPILIITCYIFSTCQKIANCLAILLFIWVIRSIYVKVSVYTPGCMHSSQMCVDVIENILKVMSVYSLINRLFEKWEFYECEVPTTRLDICTYICICIIVGLLLFGVVLVCPRLYSKERVKICLNVTDK